MDEEGDDVHYVDPRCQYHQPTAMDPEQAPPERPDGVTVENWANVLAYQPAQSCPANCWPSIRPQALLGAAALLRFEPTVRGTTYASAVARYLHDIVHGDELSGDLRDLLTERLIESWVERQGAQVDRDHRSKSITANEADQRLQSLSTARGRLRRVANAVKAEAQHKRRLPKGYPEGAYTDAECLILLTQSVAQKTPGRQRGMSALLHAGLGLGARGIEHAYLHGHHVSLVDEVGEIRNAAEAKETLGDDRVLRGTTWWNPSWVVQATLLGPRARIVTCDPNYAPGLWNLALTYPDEPLIASSTRKSTVSDVVSKLSLDPVLSLNPNRLAYTWRLRRMRDLGVAELLESAGVDTLAALDPLLED